MAGTSGGSESEGDSRQGETSKTTGMRMRTMISSNTEKNRKTVIDLLNDPPSSWQKLFRTEGISETPSIEEVLSLLEETAGSNLSGERETRQDNPKSLKPPADVRKDAIKGFILSHQNNYPSWKGIGLARAVQLATQDKIWLHSGERMAAFFKRNQYYKSQKGFGDDQNPSKSYLAWLNWGGNAGEKWVKDLDL